MLIALIASIPAFYDSLMPTPVTWAIGMYVLSGLVVLGSAWRERRHARRAVAHQRVTRSWGMTPRQERLDWVLGIALLLTATLPESHDSPPALAWRVVLALFMLYRLVRISLPLLHQAGLARLLLMASAVLVLCGIGFYWLDPAIHSVPAGLWLAFSTAATVGYGDTVPSSTASRIFSVFVVLLGYGVLSLVTASIAAMFVGTQERQVEREILRDMHNQLRAVRQEIAELRAALEEARRANPPAPPTE
jgi:voltage-gated potassium channel